jgi:hypothetical protein
MAPDVELPASVVEGDTTPIPVKRTSLGAVRLSVKGDDLCAARKRFLVAMVTGGRSWPVGGKNDVTTCAATVAGLVPGRYGATLEMTDGPTSRTKYQTIDIEPQQIADVRFELASANLTGTITLNGRPLVGATVSVTRPGSAASQATTDPGGAFRVEVAETGRFHMELLTHGLNLLGQTTVVNIVEGDNQFLWNLTGGELAIGLKNWDGQTPINLRLMGPSLGTTGALLLPPENPFKVQGLRFGRYSVAVSQPRLGRSAPSKEVTLSADNPSAELTFDLSYEKLILRVSDRRGSPIERPVVGNVSSFRQTEPGVLELYGATPGRPLRISAPGFVPVCRLPPPSGVLDLVLDRGAPIELRFASLNWRDATLFGLEGSDCAVPLLWFRAAESGEVEPGLRRVVVENFPSAGVVRLVVSGNEYTLRLPPIGPVLIRRPR